MKLDAANAAPDSWERRTVGEACARITSGGTPSRRVPSFYEQGTVPWVKTKELNDGVILETEELITELALDSSSAKLLPPGTILLAMYGATVGMLGVLGKPMACNQACCALIPGANTDRDYLYYQLLAHRQQLQGLATGAAQQNLSGAQIKQLVLPFPSLDEQRSIGRTLRILDDRITLLRETNTTLEAIAQALFKSWFVDFDPVRAKMAGRAPEGMDEATAALFPDVFEETECGVIPAGWKVGGILDIAKLLSGGTPKTDRSEYWGGSILWASAKDVSQASDPVLLTTERSITELGLNGSSTKLIPAYATAVVARGATTGRLVMFGKEMAMNQTCYALVSRQNTPTVLSLQLRREIGRLVSAAHGSVFDTITTTTFEKSVCLLPPETLCAQLEQITRPIFEKIIANVAKAQLLSQLRDALLPRLISGQLRLPEALSEVIV